MSQPSRFDKLRPHVVPETLDELDGPTTGELVLPTRLDWGPERVYTLADESDVRLAYERVIRESLRVEDLRAFLNARVLRAVWNDLFLPAWLRLLWEDRFPNLHAGHA